MYLHLKPERQRLYLCVEMSQEVKPREDSNIRWGYITLMGVERW